MNTFAYLIVIACSISAGNGASLHRNQQLSYLESIWKYNELATRKLITKLRSLNIEARGTIKLSFITKNFKFHRAELVKSIKELQILEKRSNSLINKDYKIITEKLVSKAASMQSHLEQNIVPSITAADIQQKSDTEILSMIQNIHLQIYISQSILRRQLKQELGIDLLELL